MSGDSTPYSEPNPALAAMPPHPAPRGGLGGAWDRFVGPGATPAENMLQTLLPLSAAVAAPLYARTVVEQWTALQYIVCGVLAFDLVGGVVTTATSTAKRWYHRSERGASHHFRFVLVHILHASIVSALYLEMSIRWVATVGAYLAVASALVLRAPLYLQRPVAFSMYVGSIFLSIYGLNAPAGLEWFLPVLFFKLLVSYLPFEEAYPSGPPRPRVAP